MFHDYMCTDDLQFGFKAKVGCRNAISVLSSSVDYYTRLGSTVNVATAGVRQGGVLSPVLFAVYVDDIIVNLKSSGFPCYFAGEYIGVLMYADTNIFSLPMISEVKYLGVVYV